ncbi:MAG: 4-(cytidine 5'-diphospho)-2-C-methyl-D-erythritol kinase [Ilumatobacteraceae bacterium]
MAVVDAPAKLTLSLCITGVRHDGYHLIDAEMVSLVLADTLEIEDAPSISIEVDGPFAAGVPVDRTNLVVRALETAGRTARVRITKNVPNGGGLGGGSSDAAAALRWAGFTGAEAASRLGADIPFCLVGGRARVTGIGENVQPLPFEPRDITLVVPPLHVSTPAVYARWDAMGGPRHPSGNDLTGAAMAVEPRLAQWRDRITAAAGTEPLLAGSGATWFLHGHHPGIAGSLDGAVVITTSTRP